MPADLGAGRILNHAHERLKRYNKALALSNIHKFAIDRRANKRMLFAIGLDHIPDLLFADMWALLKGDLEEQMISTIDPETIKEGAGTKPRRTDD